MQLPSPLLSATETSPSKQPPGGGGGGGGGSILSATNLSSVPGGGGVALNADSEAAAAAKSSSSPLEKVNCAGLCKSLAKVRDAERDSGCQFNRHFPPLALFGGFFLFFGDGTMGSSEIFRSCHHRKFIWDPFQAFLGPHSKYSNLLNCPLGLFHDMASPRPHPTV